MTVSGPEDEFHNKCHEKTKQTSRLVQAIAADASREDL